MQNITTTPKNGYKVTPATAAILDSMRAADALFSTITNTLRILYGDTPTEPGTAAIEDIKAQPYLEHCNAITDMLHQEIIRQLCDNLGDVENSNNTDSINI